MSAVANIVLADAQATPVNHTFVPIGPDKVGTWWWEDQTGNSPVGYNRISVSFTKPGAPSVGSTASERNNRVKIGLHTPKLETQGNNSNGYLAVPTVAYIPRAHVEFILSDRSTLQDRKDLRKFLALLAGDAQIIDMVENLRNVY